MLMTPMTPKVMASPMAASSRTEPSERPYQRCWTICQRARCRSMAVIASAAVACTVAGKSAGRLPSSPRASWSLRSRMTPTASTLSTSFEDGWVRMIAARASSITFLTRASVSLASAPSRAGSAVASRDLNTACAAARRRFGIRCQQGETADRGLHRAAQAIVETHRLEARRRVAGDGLAGGSVEDLAGRLAHINLLGFGIEQQAAVLQGADDRDRQRIAAGRHGGNGSIGIAEGIGGKSCEGLLIALRERGRAGECEQPDAQQQHRRACAELPHPSPPVSEKQEAAQLPPPASMHG